MEKHYNIIRKEIRGILNEMLDDKSVKDRDVRTQVIMDFAKSMIGYKIGPFFLRECEKPVRKLIKVGSHPEKRINLYMDGLFFNNYYIHDILTDMWYETWKKNELSENRFEKKDEKQYENCLMSDLTRMEIIEDFFKKVNNDPDYNKEAPYFTKLIDNWDGYEDQVYIQNDLKNNRFIFFEGWVDECWKSVYLKPEYKGLNKIEVIEKIAKERFPRIAKEFGFKLESHNYFKYKGKFITKITFVK